MRLQLVDVIEVEPVLEAVLDEVLRFRVDLLVREGDIERVGDTLSLEGQPSAVAGDVGEELGFVAGRARPSGAKICTLLEITSCLSRSNCT